MTINVALNSISNLQDTTTAETNINANSAAIQGGFGTALNVTGDQMRGNLDMNNNQILNLPAPATVNSPARLVDILSSSSAITIPPTGTSGAVVGLLNANLTFSGNDTFSGTTSFGIIGSATIINAGTVTASTANVTSITTTTINSSSITTTTINSSSITSTTMTASTVHAITAFTAAAATVTGLITTGSLTVSSTFTPLAGIVGVTASSNAATGNVGEILITTVTSSAAISMTTGTATTVTNITVSPGDWDIYAIPSFSGSATSITFVSAMVTTTTAVISAAPGVYISQVPGSVTALQAGQSVISPGTIGPLRASLSTATVYCLNTYAVFTGTAGTVNAFGVIEARRVR